MSFMETLSALLGLSSEPVAVCDAGVSLTGFSAPTIRHQPSACFGRRVADLREKAKAAGFVEAHGYRVRSKVRARHLWSSVANERPSEDDEFLSFPFWFEGGGDPSIEALVRLDGLGVVIVDCHGRSLHVADTRSVLFSSRNELGFIRSKDFVVVGWSDEKGYFLR